MALEAFDLSKDFIHLGLGSSATALPDFSWSSDHMMDYIRAHLSDRDERRLVGIVELRDTWRHWECHTGGDEVVVQLSGRCDVIVEVDGVPEVVPMGPGQALINPRGAWHTVTVHEPGTSLFITAGRMTKYRPRSPEDAVAAAGPAGAARVGAP
jgi:uncharacterized cupin superfamily protein